MEDKLIIGGKEFNPSKMAISHNDMWSQNSGRTKKGTWVGDLLGYKWRLDVSIEPCSRTTLEELYSVIESPKIAVLFTNPKTNSQETFYAYPGATSINVYNYKVRQEITYQGVSFSLVER